MPKSQKYESLVLLSPMTMIHYPKRFKLRTQAQRHCRLGVILQPFCKILITLAVCIFSSISINAAEEKTTTPAETPLQIAVIGLTHTHVHWIFESAKKERAFEIAGVVETNEELAQRYCEQHGYPMSNVYATMQSLLQANPQIEAFAAFGSIYEHLEVVEFAAPRGIHVMVEKPLAVNLDHARQMVELANANNIELLVNYETTWYPTNHKAYELVHSDRIGEIRKVVIHDGHKGPSKLGINREFLDWLLDPKLNGGGAVTDFGCYGANLMTWIMEGKRPISVTAVLQQFQPENNPKVDDEATIILTYESCQAIIQASWNWPIGRKDMDIYGLTGTISALNRHQLRIRDAKGYDDFDEDLLQLPERSAPVHDPFVYFAAAIRGEIEPLPYDLSATPNNLIVMEILDAAIKSANSGRTVYLENQN